VTIIIWQHETNAREEWLQVNDDGSLTHHGENSGWPLMRQGLKPVDRRMTAEEAKAKWPSFAAKIDQALADLNSN
jgi:hypothetical protein